MSFLLADQKEYKTEIIARIMRTFPGRRFILVGDSGEQDPEIYAAIATQFPGRVVAILIRDAQRPDDSAQRYEKLFEGSTVPWKLFKQPGNLAHLPALQQIAPP